MRDLFEEEPKDMASQSVLIVIEGEPRGKGRPRFAARGKFGTVFTDDATKAYELEIQMEVARALYGQNMADRIYAFRKLPANEMFLTLQFAPRFTGPVAMEMVIAHSIRPSWSKKKQEAARLGNVAPTIKIDFDNCAKVFCDAFNGCMWVDDTQVVEARITKRFSESPYVSVRVTPIDLPSAQEA